MILVDTSVWVDHLRRGDSHLASLLEASRACIHPFVIGELACGNLKSRKIVLELLQALPVIQSATEDEVLFFIERHDLMGRGIGYIDAHLLAATALQKASLLWTRDKRLADIAHRLGLAYTAAGH